MAGPQIGGFTEAQLAPGMSIVFEAISPTDGSAVSGVKVSAIGILAEGANVGSGTFASGAFLYVPGPKA